MTTKKYKSIVIVDTSVLAHDPNALYEFKNTDIILPIIVIEELDKVKKMSNDAGRNARIFIRNLDKLIEKSDFIKGAVLNNNITLRIDTSMYDGIGSDPTYGDAKILGCAIAVKKQNPKRNIIFVSRDINLRIRAKALNLEVQGYEKDTITSTELFQGFRQVSDITAGQELFDNHTINCKDVGLNDLLPNEFVLFTNKLGTGIAAGRRIGDQIVLVQDKSPWGLKLRGKEQLFTADLLLDTQVPLVSVIGRAGCGKSLVSLACGLELVLNQRKYDRFMIYRPLQVMANQEVGFLPGTLSEKLEPHFLAIADSMQFLFSGGSRKKDGWKDQLYQFIDNGIIQQEPLTYIRGRSIANSFILIDEAQNLSKDEMKTILTRAGENSKIVISGDIEQIDAHNLDAMHNGLTYVIDKFKNYSIAGHITLLKGERSELASLASKIL